ncbi:unnamed protein product [Protopolystoma xenopodis]|uniref:Uncharacterized protein n=1 Tax=Protopolystoma xenopodis TaxID=117903 RepID=A0A448X7K1_9PLAT|nr:unnamed protein product [Protopolystoma xenopodis]
MTSCRIKSTAEERTSQPRQCEHAASADQAAALADLHARLNAAERETRRCQKRASREIHELERLAEEQCMRAGGLAEQLAWLRRQYVQLKSQVLTAFSAKLLSSHCIINIILSVKSVFTLGRLR